VQSWAITYGAERSAIARGPNAKGAGGISRAFAHTMRRRLFPCGRPMLLPLLEHTEHDGSEECEGDNGSEHIKPRSQFHHDLLDRTQPAHLKRANLHLGRQV
jgi:hypothetical protein